MNALLAFLLRLVLVFLSYIFVGWIIYTIYNDLRNVIRDRKEKFFPPITLMAEINQEQFEKQFTNPEVILGRDPACTFPIEDETISHRHCNLSFHHKQWWAMDLGSTNGTYLNDNPIEAAAVLTDGDELRLGRVAIMIKLD